MKTFCSIVAVFAFAAFFAVSAYAQAAATTPKIGIVNTGAFDTKEGITKYVNAMNTLEVQMKPELTALQTMNNRIQALQKELEGFKKQLEDPSPKVPIDKTKIQASAQTKYEEYQKLGLEFEYKQKEYKASLERRELSIMSPIRQDIGNALQEFGKKNGYMMILDASKLDQNGLLLAFDPKFDVTKEFITFFNTRPATTAAAAVK